MSHPALTTAQRAALRWLRSHTGDGMFDRNGVLLAAGESAPFMRATWNTLRDYRLVEFYQPNWKARTRVRITANGSAAI